MANHRLSHRRERLLRYLHRPWNEELNCLSHRYRSNLGETLKNSTQFLVWRWHGGRVALPRDRRCTSERHADRRHAEPPIRRTPFASHLSPSPLLRPQKVFQSQACELVFRFLGTSATSVRQFLVNCGSGSPGVAIFENLCRIEPGPEKPELISRCHLQRQGHHNNSRGHHPSCPISRSIFLFDS